MLCAECVCGPGCHRNTDKPRSGHRMRCLIIIFSTFIALKTRSLFIYSFKRGRLKARSLPFRVFQILIVSLLSDTGMVPLPTPTLPQPLLQSTRGTVATLLPLPKLQIPNLENGDITMRCLTCNVLGPLWNNHFFKTN